MSFLRVRRFAALGFVLSASTALVVACATASVPFDPGDGGTGVDAAGDASACDADLALDPKNCGTCGKTCASSEVCSSGACKNQCDAPLRKCTGVTTCVDVAKDPKNCGQCGTLCTGPDAGPEGGTGNPDSGIPAPDGGFDAGTGWALPTPNCDASTCGLACAGGTTICSDKICWDTQNAHDHCGDCTTACASDTEWCGGGHCCPVGKQWCTNACVDVVNDPNNCGGCGTKCSGGTPMCVAGICKAGNHNTSQLTYDYSGGTGGCGDFSIFYTQNFGMKTYDDCETLANQYGAQMAGGPNLYAYSAPYATFVRWVGEQSATVGYVNSGSWNVVNTSPKTTPQYCVLGYANGTTHGSTTLPTVLTSLNGKTYNTQDYGVISESVCYSNARAAGARPLNPAMFNLSIGAAHMVENHSCHGSVEYNGSSYTTNGGSAHTYRCLLGYTP